MQHPKRPIDARLRATADLVLSVLHEVPNPIVCDIGCDHGYLTSYLLRQRPDLSVIAADISGLSLAKARLLIDPGIYGRRIVFRQADGLDALKDGERADCIVLAGMGGRLILDILQKAQMKIAGARLVLQANTNVPLLRSGLAKIGIAIMHEEYTEAGGRQYVILLAAEGETHIFNERQALLGIIPDEEARSFARKRYLNALLNIRILEMGKASQKQTTKALAKVQELKQQASWIREEIGE